MADDQVLLPAADKAPDAVAADKAPDAVAADKAPGALDEKRATTPKKSLSRNVGKMSDEEVERLLTQKYQKMDEKQLQELMARKLVMISKEERKTRLITESIKNSTEQLAHYQKVLVGILIGAIVVFVLFIVYKVLVVYIQYYKFIKWVNSAQGGTTVWPAGGLGTALSLVYPIMNGWFGFTDPYLPLAAFYTWQQYGNVVLSNGQTVNDNATYCLQGMYEFAALGGQPNNPDCGVVSGDDIPVFEILCCGWGNHEGVEPCSSMYCNTSFSTSDYLNAASSGMAGGTQGGFLGHAVTKSNGGTAAAFSIMFVVNFAISLWQAKLNMEAQADANNCA
jgi:hypothetical protein